MGRYKAMLAFEPPLPSRIYGINGDDVEDEEIDDVKDLLDLYRLHSILQDATWRQQELISPPWWTPPDEQAAMLRQTLSMT